MITSDQFQKLLLYRRAGVGAVAYRRNLQKYGDAESANYALGTDDDLRARVENECESADKIGAYYLFDDENGFPANYARAKNHSPILCAIGRRESFLRPAIGVVGTRHASAAGRELIADFAEKIAGSGVVVVSGMAMGIDSAAAHGALSAASAQCATVAVLAGGVDQIWPMENESLYYDIIARGAVASDQPIGTAPSANLFVARNKIIAGLSESLVLTEATLNSGSMTTAGFMNDLGRQIWAVPGSPFDPRASGPNALIRTGRAKLLDNVDAVLAGAVAGISAASPDLFDASPADFATAPATDSEKVLELLGAVAVDENKVADMSGISIIDVKKILAELEINGCVLRTDGGFVRLSVRSKIGQAN